MYVCHWDATLAPLHTTRPQIHSIHPYSIPYHTYTTILISSRQLHPPTGSNFSLGPSLPSTTNARPHQHYIYVTKKTLMHKFTHFCSSCPSVRPYELVNIASLFPRPKCQKGPSRVIHPTVFMAFISWFHHVAYSSCVLFFLCLLFF